MSREKSGEESYRREGKTTENVMLESLDGRRCVGGITRLVV